MEIRNNADGLETLLGVHSTSPAQTQQVRNWTAAGQSAFGGDRATLSSAGTGMAQNALDHGVRADKVAAVQAALAAGTYDVPASALASRLVEAMLGDGQFSS